MRNCILNYKRKRVFAILLLEKKNRVLRVCLVIPGKQDRLFVSRLKRKCASCSDNLGERCSDIVEGVVTSGQACSYEFD